MKHYQKEICKKYGEYKVCPLCPDARSLPDKPFLLYHFGVAHNMVDELLEPQFRIPASRRRSRQRSKSKEDELLEPQFRIPASRRKSRQGYREGMGSKSEEEELLEPQFQMSASRRKTGGDESEEIISKFREGGVQNAVERASVHGLVLQKSPDLFPANTMVGKIDQHIEGDAMNTEYECSGEDESSMAVLVRPSSSTGKPKGVEPLICPDPLGEGPLTSVTKCSSKVLSETASERLQTRQGLPTTFPRMFSAPVGHKEAFSGDPSAGSPAASAKPPNTAYSGFLPASSGSLQGSLGPSAPPAGSYSTLEAAGPSTVAEPITSLDISSLRARIFASDSESDYDN
jgi:hypothetical protein